MEYDDYIRREQDAVDEEHLIDTFGTFDTPEKEMPVQDTLGDRVIEDEPEEVPETRQRPPLLPHAPKDLAPFVRVVLKTNKDGATAEEDIKKLVHQSVIRRH
eukprot:9512145-Prorocentrum_lima.AAC.1